MGKLYLQTEQMEFIKIVAEQLAVLELDRMFYQKAVIAFDIGDVHFYTGDVISSLTGKDFTFLQSKEKMQVNKLQQKKLFTFWVTL